MLIEACIAIRCCIRIGASGSPVLGGVLSAVTVATLNAPGCAFPVAPGSDDEPEPEGASASSATGPRRQLNDPAMHASSPKMALGSAISVVDSTINVAGGSPCFKAYGSIYLSNVWTSGCPTLVATDPNGGRASVPAARGARFTHVPLLALGRATDTTPPPPAHPYTYAFPAYINGTRYPDGHATVLPHAGPPPHDLQSKHLWEPDAGVTFQSAGAVDVQ